MKKYFVFIGLFFLIGGISAQAQLKFGLKAGVNLANASFGDGLDNFKTKNLTGFQAGPMLEFKFIDLAVLYSQQGFKLDQGGGWEDYKLNNLQVPVNLKLKIGLLPKLLKVYGSAGPYVNFNLSTNLIDQMKSQSFGAGLNFGFGVELFKHLQVGANYQLGLTDDFSSTDSLEEAYKGRSTVWSVTAAYLF